MLNSRKIKSKVIMGLIIASFAFIFIFITGFLFGSPEFLSFFLSKLLKGFFRLIIGVFIYSALASITVQFLNRRGYSTGNWKRWAIEFMVLVTISSIWAYIEVNYHTSQIDERNQLLRNPHLISALINTLIGFVVFTVYEIWSVLEQNQQLQLSLAETEREKIATQLASLQQKLNPHFLFNSLNVLSELIYEDREKANTFIKEFSNIYRYVLDLNDEPVVTVRKELEFLKSYLYLQKIRFGESLEVQIKLSDKTLDRYIPPLSFQLLLENAIKHNRISNSAPLKVELYEEDAYLVVKNNLQLRIDTRDSKGVGLSSLKSTYSFLSERAPKFGQEDGNYIARIPILNKAK